MNCRYPYNSRLLALTLGLILAVKVSAARLEDHKRLLGLFKDTQDVLLTINSEIIQYGERLDTLIERVIDPRAWKSVASRSVCVCVIACPVARAGRTPRELARAADPSARTANRFVHIGLSSRRLSPRHRDGFDVAGFLIDPVLHAKLTWRTTVGLGTVMVLVTAVMSLVPMTRIEKINVTDAFR